MEGTDRGQYAGADAADELDQADISETPDEEDDDDESVATDGTVISEMDSFVANAKTGLLVPDDPSITCEVSDTPSYWEGTASYVWYVAFYKDGKIVASADCGSSGFPSRSIMAYHEN